MTDALTPALLDTLEGLVERLEDVTDTAEKLLAVCNELAPSTPTPMLRRSIDLAKAAALRAREETKT